MKCSKRALEGFGGIACIADDVIVYGKGDVCHDLNVTEFLQRCDELGIELNKAKCQLGLSEISFQGHVISTEGLKLDQKR